MSGKIVLIRNANPIKVGGRAKIIRHVFCPGYNVCLDLAVEKRWLNFSCGKCNLRNRYHGESEAFLDRSEFANTFHFDMSLDSLERVSNSNFK